jgi:hypothetical protein
MTPDCRNHQDALIDAARGIPVGEAASTGLAAHLEGCAGCSARLAREQALTAGLRALARSVEVEPPSRALEARLLDGFNGFRRAAPVPAARVAPSRAWMAAAAVLLVAGLGFLWQRTDGTPSSTPGNPPRAAEVSEFVPWPGAAALPAFESGQLVRTELPASALPVLGLVPAGTVVGNTVTADVLVGQDGLARAVRLVIF